jgi:hypothetical protein
LETGLYGVTIDITGKFLTAIQDNAQFEINLIAYDSRTITYYNAESKSNLHSNIVKKTAVLFHETASNLNETIGTVAYFPFVVLDGNSTSVFSLGFQMEFSDLPAGTLVNLAISSLNMTVFRLT